ncbi:MAG: hypothetical protein IJW71_02165 [Clostridia bacterium]|nr:hypothetical protein [Clostridia bacterium]
MAMLAKPFGLPLETTSKGYFAGKEFEILNAPIRGTYGHVAISTNFVDRAIAYFKRMGVEFDESTVTYGAKGKPNFIDFKDEISGFAFIWLRRNKIKNINGTENIRPVLFYSSEGVISP